MKKKNVTIFYKVIFCTLCGSLSLSQQIKQNVIEIRPTLIVGVRLYFILYDDHLFCTMTVLVESLILIQTVK